MKTYQGKHLDMVAFPLGGIGAGMIALEGNGSFGSTSIRNAPDIDFTPDMFSAIHIKGEQPQAKVLEGPIPDYKVFAKDKDAARGLRKRPYGLPRFSNASFSSRFPFGSVSLKHDAMPLDVEITGWSPFIPNEADDCSMPFVGIEYTFKNTSKKAIDAIYYFCAPNFMKINDHSKVYAIDKGFVLSQSVTPNNPHHEGAFSATVDADNVFVNTAWFRGVHYDTRTMLWNAIEQGVVHHQDGYLDHTHGESPGGSLAVEFRVEAGQTIRIPLRFTWYVPKSSVQYEDDIDPTCNRGRCTHQTPFERDTYVPFYTTRIKSIEAATKMWRQNYDRLRNRTETFTNTWYDTSLPEPLIEAVSANLSILKSPTLLRQTDGRMWGFEGCCDTIGCCAGSCTHVYNYAQSLPHLFTKLEQTFRYTEFNEMQDSKTGHQNFRAYLPIRDAKHEKHAAVDGQLGGIIKTYREWRISGDTEWMRELFPKIKQSLDYCIDTWDPEHEGIIKEPHHNTYDIEFWGPESMALTFYLAALKAFCAMAEAIDESCELYTELYKRGRDYLENKLFNGSYYIQHVMTDNLKQSMESYTTLAHNASAGDESPETKALIEKEGPKYQYKNGCLSDAVLGAWLGELSGLSDIVDHKQLTQTLESIYAYNFKHDLSLHANPQRAGYTINDEAGLLLCTWPLGGKPSLPFIYSDEVWTGIEYQVASHLLMHGMPSKALTIVNATRSRYGGTRRNPFNEYECGHFYTRAMASYALLQGYTGVRYDAVDQTLYASTRNSENYRVFLSTASGYGTVTVNNNHVTVDVVEGKIPVKRTVITP